MSDVRVTAEFEFTDKKAFLTNVVLVNDIPLSLENRAHISSFQLKPTIDKLKMIQIVAEDIQRLVASRVQQDGITDDRMEANLQRNADVILAEYSAKKEGWNVEYTKAETVEDVINAHKLASSARMKRAWETRRANIAARAAKLEREAKLARRKKRS